MKTFYNVYTAWFKLVQGVFGVTNSGWYLLSLLTNAAVIGGVAFDLFSYPTTKVLLVTLALFDSISIGARMYIADRFARNPKEVIDSMMTKGHAPMDTEDFESKSKQAIAIINKYGDKFSERMKGYPDAVPGDPTADRVLKECMAECNAELETLGMTITNVSAMKDDAPKNTDTTTDKRKMH